MSSLSAVPVDEELAERLRALAQQITESLDERDRLIVEASTAGGSLREIAALVGLTHMGVSDILRRKGEKARPAMRCANCGYSISQDSSGGWFHDFSMTSACDDHGRSVEPEAGRGRGEPSVSETR